MQSQPNLASLTYFDPAVLAIDVGRAAMQATILPLDRGIEAQPILVHGPDIGHHVFYRSSDFPILLRETFNLSNPELLILQAQLSPLSPLQVCCMLIAEQQGMSTLSQMEGYDKLQQHFTPEDRDTFISIFEKHLEDVKYKSVSLAGQSALEITHLAVICDWNGLLLEAYRILLGRMWGSIPAENITMVPETEAMGHWLSHPHLGEIPRTASNIILLKFDPYNMCTNKLKITRHNSDYSDRNFDFVSEKGRIDCQGGSERHCSIVMEKISSDMEKRKIRCNAKEERCLFTSCGRNYDTRRQECDETLSFVEGYKTDDPGHQQILFNFGKKEAEIMYADSFGNPFNMLEKSLKLEEERETTVVVLYGRSFRYRYTYDTAKRIIENAGLVHESYSDPAMVSNGAAFAVAKAIAIRLLASQAAFVVGVRSNEEPLQVIVRNDSRKVFINRQQDTNIVIAYCPLLDRRDREEGREPDTIELASLGIWCKGKLAISLRYQYNAADLHCSDWLHVSVEDGNKTRYFKRRVRYDSRTRVCSMYKASKAQARTKDPEVHEPSSKRRRAPGTSPESSQRKSQRTTPRLRCNTAV